MKKMTAATAATAIPIIAEWVLADTGIICLPARVTLCGGYI
jgi:hypothetical protein